MFKGSVASDDMQEVVQALKSAAEPTRLRLLFLLSQAEYTVTELCAVLAQSQPASPAICACSPRPGFWTGFANSSASTTGRLSAAASAMAVAAAVHARSGCSHAQARPGARGSGDRRSRPAGGATLAVTPRLQVGGDAARPGAPPRELAGVLLEELGPAGVGELLDIGTGSGRMLELLGPRAHHAIGVDLSAPALRLARTRVHGAGLRHCELRRGDMYGLPFEDARFDTVTIEQVLAPPSARRRAGRGSAAAAQRRAAAGDRGFRSARRPQRRQPARGTAALVHRGRHERRPPAALRSRRPAFDHRPGPP